MSEKANDELPKTLESAVMFIFEALSDDNKRLVNSASEDDLSDFHFGLGAGIRNTLELWNPNSPLV